MNLAPNGHRWIDDPPTVGLWVITGPRAWQYANNKPFVCVVLPPGSRPAEFEWPATSGPAIIFETGSADDDLQQELATAIMLAGAPSVVAIRESMLCKPDACVFYEAVSHGDA